MKKANKSNIKSAAKQASLLLQIMELQDKLDEAKKLYSEMDRLTEQFKEAYGLEPQMLEGSRIELVDNFSSKNTMFKTAAFKRFELKIVKAS